MAATANTDSTGVERIALDNEKAVNRILAQSMRKVQDIVRRKLAAGKDKALAGKGLADFEQTVRAFYDSLGVKIGRSLRDGLDEGMKEAYDAAKDAMRTDGKRRAILGKPDTATINRYMQGTFEEIAMRTNKMAAEHIRHLREVGAEVFRTAAFTGQTRREVTRELMEKAAQIPGFRFIDHGGTVWKDATYFKMLARTETMNTGRAIYDDTCAKNGYDVVRLSHSGNSCEACSAYEGTVFSLTGATPGIPTKQDLLDAGVFHPNCTHTYTALTDLELEQEGLLDKRDETKNDRDEEAERAKLEEESAQQEQKEYEERKARYHSDNMAAVDKILTDKKYVQAIREEAVDQVLTKRVKPEDFDKCVADMLNYHRAELERVAKTLSDQYKPGMKEIGDLPKLVFDSDKSKISRFIPGSNEIHIKTAPSSDFVTKFQLSDFTIKHEFGHWLQNGAMKSYAGMEGRMRDAAAADWDYFQKKNAGNMADYKGDLSFDVFAKKLYGNERKLSVDEYGAAAALADSLGDLSAGKFGFGHDPNYYTNIQKTFPCPEAFANIRSVQGKAREIAREMFPNMTKIVEELDK